MLTFLFLLLFTFFFGLVLFSSLLMFLFASALAHVLVLFHVLHCSCSCSWYYDNKVKSNQIFILHLFFLLFIFFVCSSSCQPVPRMKQHISSLVTALHLIPISACKSFFLSLSMHSLFLSHVPPFCLSFFWQNAAYTRKNQTV